MLENDTELMRIATQHQAEMKKKDKEIEDLKNAK